MYTASELEAGPKSVPQTRSMIVSRASTCPGWRSNSSSRANSVREKDSGRPRRLPVRATGSTVRSSQPPPSRPCRPSRSPASGAVRRSTARSRAVSSSSANGLTR